MAPSSHKIIVFSISILISALVNLVDCGFHGGNSGLAEILAAGLVTLLLRDGVKHHFGSPPLGLGHPPYGYNFHLPALMHAYHYPIYGFGHHFGGFGFTPNFGGMRYKVEPITTLPNYNLPEDLSHDVIGSDFPEDIPDSEYKADLPEPEDAEFDLVRDIIKHEERNTLPVDTESPQKDELIEYPELPSPESRNEEKSYMESKVTNSKSNDTVYREQKTPPSSDINTQ